MDDALRRRRVSRAGIVRRLRALGDVIDDRLPHGRRVFKYRGFEVVYSRRTSLVQRIERWGDYEPELVAAVVEELRRWPQPLIVDVGANIGLISLAAAAALPDARVVAFEPGAHQRRLFAETIRRNGLDDRISLHALALADEVGTRRFATHASRHAAGDGFLDTGRAGRARFVTVETDTLDAWWRREGTPRVAVVKLDTEGSELLVMRGGAALIAHCRPVLFLEIHPENLRPYPYDAADVRAHVEAFGYALEPFGRTEFVARPR